MEEITWDVSNLVYNEISYQPQLVSRISSINRMSTCSPTWRLFEILYTKSTNKGGRFPRGWGVLSPLCFEKISQLDLYFFRWVGSSPTLPQVENDPKFFWDSQLILLTFERCLTVHSPLPCTFQDGKFLSNLQYHFSWSPKIYKVFLVPFGHQTTKTRVGGTEFPKSFSLSSTGNSTVFRVFLRSCRKELGYQESCPEDGSQLTKNGSQLHWHLCVCERKKSEDTLNKKQVRCFFVRNFYKV